MVNKLISLFQQKVYLYFGLILMLGIFLRLYKLETGLPILNRDEAALAYNAKLLIESGTDEWGESWPLQFKSFGDYKLPGYIISLIPTYVVFGETDWSVRINSVISGIVIIVVLSLFTNRLFGLNSKNQLFFITLLIAATSPFTIFYSRMAWEANLALALLLSSSFLLFDSNLNLKTGLIGTLLYFLAIFTYNTPLLLFPVLLIAFLAFHWKLQKAHLLVLLIWTVSFLIGVFSLLSIADQKSSITIFSDPTIAAQFPVYRAELPSSVISILGNKYVYWGKLIIERYINTWSPQFLALSGGTHPWHTIPGFGHLYIEVLVLSYLGILSLMKVVINKLRQLKFYTNFRKHLSLLILTLFSPLPAVITVDAPHATRSLFFFCMLILLAGVGFQQVTIFIQNTFSIKPKISYLIFSLILLLHSGYYFYSYLYIWPQNYSQALFIGLPEVVKNEYEPIAVIDPEGYAYILFAWYKKMPAEEFFNTIQRHQPDQIGLQYGYKVGNYTFYKTFEDIQTEKKVLYQLDSRQWAEKTL